MGRYAEAHFHESTSSGTGSVNDSRGSWQNNYNPVGNAPLSVVSLASSLTNQIHCFSLLFKIALSVPGNSEHFLTDKSKVALPQKLPPRGNRWQQFSSFKSVIQELKGLVYLVNQLFWREKTAIICLKCFAGKKLIKKNGTDTNGECFKVGPYHQNKNSTKHRVPWQIHSSTWAITFAPKLLLG